MDLVFWSSAGSKVVDAAQVGRDEEKAWTILQQILGDQTMGRFYKIGITDCPPRRSIEHNMVELSSREVEDMVYKVYQKGFWSKMHVIYQTTSAKDIAEAEKSFIERVSKKYGGALRKAPPRTPWLQQKGDETQTLFPFNVRGGGGGLKTGAQAYFLYLLVQTLG